MRSSDPSPTLRSLRRWFTQPPRAHGEIDEARTVGYLELFYDLVFVVLISQVARTLAGDSTWSGVADFAVVFGLIWFAWFNGSLYHELHGREDGRNRTYIFVQMLVLVVLATYAGDAAGAGGRGFALTYAALLGAVTVQWYGVRRYDTEEWLRASARYIVMMLIAIVVVLVSAAFPDDQRVMIWAALNAFWILCSVLLFVFRRDVQMAIVPTDSLTERFGLLTIIVLGEVVVGVVGGLLEAPRNLTTVATGLLALSVGFGFWWNYFDLTGNRAPRPGRVPLAMWLVLHLPLTAAVAAAGAGMVGLIEHAGDERTPMATAWLIGGATAVLLLCVAALLVTIDDIQAAHIRRILATLVVGAAVVLVITALRPQPWALALSFVLVLGAVWAVAFSLESHRKAAVS